MLGTVCSWDAYRGRGPCAHARQVIAPHLDQVLTEVHSQVPAGAESLD